MLEAIRVLGLEKHCRFYQASTSELFGDTSEEPQSETTPMRSCSLYAVAKLFAYWTTINYRQAYGLPASNGILFNHECPLRGESFVTRKISRGVAAIHQGRLDRLRLGNLEARRDWGHARDYVEAMWLMLQQPTPDDYVIATGQSHSVREFVDQAFQAVGIAIDWEAIDWEESGVEEVGRCRQSGRVVIEIDPAFYRPPKSNHLKGDSGEEMRNLGWRHRTSFEALVTEMVEADLKAAASSGPVFNTNK